MDFDHATIPQLVGWACTQFADVDAVLDSQEGGRRLSYRQLGEAVDTAAAGLVARGIEPGDAVGVWAPNAWEWVVAGLAVARAGGVIVPVNTRYRGREAAYVLRRSRARLLFTVNGFLGYDYPAMLAQAGEPLPDLAGVVILRGEVPEGCTSFDELLAGASPATRAEVERRSAAVTPDDTALIMFTSGTTGDPKGVMVRSGAPVRAFRWYTEYLGVRRGDRVLVVSPYFHAFGLLGGILCCLIGGGTNVPFAVWDPAAALRKIQDEQIAVVPGAPAIFQSLLNQDDLDRHDLSSLRSSITGAASVPEEMVVQMRSRLGFETVITAYGMTETSGLATICRPEDDPKTIATTSGAAIPGVEIKIVDDAGAEVPRNATGEILVRGYNVMPGYFDHPEQTAEAIDADGWLHTGDVGVMDERGYIDITDRKKDMFIVGGFNAYPAEIERMMIEHPAIGQVAVVGVPDERLGEVGAAFVVPAPGPATAPEALIAWCRDRMANFKVPTHLWLVDSLPLTPSNKVVKGELRQRAHELLGTPDPAVGTGRR